MLETMADGSIKQAQKSVEQIRSFGSPSDLNKYVIRDFIAALEEKISSSTVRSRLSLLSAICQDLVAQDYLQRNPFLDVPYTARSKQERPALLIRRSRCLRTMNILATGS